MAQDRPTSLTTNQISEMATKIKNSLESITFKDTSEIDVTIKLLNSIENEKDFKEDFAAFFERLNISGSTNIDLRHFESIYEDLQDPVMFGIGTDAVDEFRKVMKKLLHGKVEELSSLDLESRDKFIAEQNAFIQQKKQKQAKVIAGAATQINQLYNAINNVVKNYLEHDNPPRSKFVQGITSLLGMGGEEGRIRASNYVDKLRNYKETSKSTADLAAKVIVDILNEEKGSPLGSSKKLRNQLLEIMRPHLRDVCTFYGISEWDISAAAHRTMEQRQRSQDHVNRLGGYIPSSDHVTMDDMMNAQLNLIKEKVQNHQRTPDYP